METFGRILLGLGLLLIVVGGLFLLLGRLGVTSFPGDVSFRRGNLRILVPLGTSLLVSIVATIVWNLILRR